MSDTTTRQGAMPPVPDWENVTAEQGCDRLLSLRDGEDPSRMEAALRAMPQKTATARTDGGEPA